jgi:hypothetical protein
MVPGFDDAKTAEMRARLDDRLGLWALPPVLRQARNRTGAVPGPGLRHLDRLAMAVSEMPRCCLGRVVARHAPNWAAPNRAPFLPLRGSSAGLVRKSLGCG